MKKLILGSAISTLSIFLIASCGGGGVPAGDVAAVEDEGSISQQEFDKYLKISAIGAQQGAEEVVIPDPPSFSKCVANLKEQQEKIAKEAEKNDTEAPEELSDSELKTQCSEQYDALKGEVLGFLISSKWIEGEAKELDVSVSDAEIKAEFEKQKEQAFPKAKDYKKFLKESGMTEEDILFRFRVNLLSEKVRNKALTDKADIDEAGLQKHFEGEVTDEDVTDFYEENKEDQFTSPETRDIEVVVTETEKKAQEAKQQLEDGKSFKEVAKEFSVDEATKETGKLNGVQEGTQDQAFDQAAFSAEKGKLEGPVETSLGYYVFRVTKITPGETQKLDDALKEQIKQQLVQQNQQEALEEFINDFQDKWRDRTECAEEYLVQECKNGPEPEEPQPSNAPPPQGQQDLSTPPAEVGAAPEGAATPESGAAPAPATP